MLESSDFKHKSKFAESGLSFCKSDEYDGVRDDRALCSQAKIRFGNRDHSEQNDNIRSGSVYRTCDRSPSEVEGWIEEDNRAGCFMGPIVRRCACANRQALRLVHRTSHNPFHDNGIKLFGSDGFKLCDAAQDKIEELLDHP